MWARGGTALRAEGRGDHHALVKALLMEGQDWERSLASPLSRVLRALLRGGRGGEGAPRPFASFALRGVRLRVLGQSEVDDR